MAVSFEHTGKLTFRPARQVMDLDRLGSLYPFRLSFMRVLTRNLLRHKWQIERTRFTLDRNGIGEIIYTITTPGNRYSFVAFAHDLDPELRSDRVIAERWDITATLCAGDIDEAHLNLLRENVPKQERGRLDNRSLVLTRGNRSSRNFGYVIDQLANGQQPDVAEVAKVGYLYRTTAVYGSGKFGMCDWEHVKETHADFARPFAAEMFACFMLRQISFDIVEHIAAQRAPHRAVMLSNTIKRYLGIGNATGLGMAPFLINHPLLINQWVTCREEALARVRMHGEVNSDYRNQLRQLLIRARQHLSEIVGTNSEQTATNAQAIVDLEALIAHSQQYSYTSWEPIIERSELLDLDAQEILNSCLIELYPDLVDELADAMSVGEGHDLRPEQTLKSLKSIVEDRYDWALSLDFTGTSSRRIFWYVSAEKMEPRIGMVNVDSGYEKRMNIAIGQRVQECYEYICEHVDRNPDERVAHFLIQFPSLRSIVQRIQTMAQTRYGEIRANILDANFAPTQLMRCKLAFFGVGKFDPKSRLWVRNTMFQGAPLIDDIHASNRGAENPHIGAGDTRSNQPHHDDWAFPLIPKEHDTRIQ